MSNMKMLTPIKLYIVLLFSTIAVQSFAQQDAMYTQYMCNTLAVNPGYAGSRDALTITALSRTQWIGIYGRPVTNTLTLHSPLSNDALALGLSVVQEKIGPISSTQVYGDFAYRVHVSKVARLSFGLKAGINNYNIGLTNLKLNDQGDAVFAQDVKNSLTPNFGFGVYYYAPSFYLGLSAPKLLENKITSSTATVLNQRRHYFLIAGSAIDLDVNLKFTPTLLVKVVPNAPLELDVTPLFLIHEKFAIGPMYRLHNSIGAIVQYNFTPQFKAGYAYDYFFNQLSAVNKGTHEIMLTYDFLFKSDKLRSPRYF